MSSILNLLVNACDAMPNGGELRVRAYNEDQQAVIEVADTGVGIDPQHLPHIFEFHYTTKEHSGGTGLGLHNVKWAVEKVHGGSVIVESELGKGTTFRLLMPMYRLLKRHS